METVWVLGDQLRMDTAAFQEAGEDAAVLMIESREHARRLPFHKHKLILLWSAMRHFAQELRQRGREVDYYEQADDYNAALRQHIETHRPKRLVLTETAEYGRADAMARSARGHGVPVDVVPNSMFLSDKDAFQRHAEGKKTFVMERFYRSMRRETNLLMDGDEPAGGAWNFDKQNRERPPKDLSGPPIPRYEPDATTRDVRRIVDRDFADHFGASDRFAWPVTRKDAEGFLEDFLDQRLPSFGPYQDAMVLGEPTLFHSLLSPLLNIGLLEPLQVCRQAEARYRQGAAPINSVEGFIRQILGWREFVYQVYHGRMPGYIESNHFEADIDLPQFYWDAQTDMRCVREAVETLRREGTNHHIQRLMITGNFALIAGLNPQQVNAWYWLAYADAYEWVVTPNVIGMALFADGGVLATKPYAASANYVNKMSDYCKHCRYKHNEAVGEEACPFNSLFWDFLGRNRGRIGPNPRLAGLYANMERRNPDKLDAMRAHAAALRDKLAAGRAL